MDIRNKGRLSDLKYMGNLFGGIKSPLYKFLLLFTCLPLFISGCGIPMDETITDIPLEEVQEKVPFQVCLPSYLPGGVYQDPLLDYHAEFGDPQESSVIIHYLSHKQDNQIMELRELYAPGHTDDLADDREFDRKILRRDLVAWLVGWEEAWETMEDVTDSYQGIEGEDGVLYRVLVISAPVELQSVIITWGFEPVGFDIYSLLPAEETLRIAQSIGNCNE